MKVLQISTSSDFLQFTAPLIRGLSQAGLELHVVCAAGKELEEIGSTVGVTAHAVPMARGIDLAQDAQSLPALIALFHRIQPDIVHAHTPKAGLLGMLAASTTRVPGRVYQTHGLRYETSVGVRRYLLQSTERISAALAHQVICVSQSVREKALRDRIILASKSCVLGRGSAAGIDVAAYRLSDWSSAGEQFRIKLGLPAGAEMYSLRRATCARQRA